MFTVEFYSTEAQAIACLSLTSVPRIGDLVKFATVPGALMVSAVRWRYDLSESGHILEVTVVP